MRRKITAGMMLLTLCVIGTLTAAFDLSLWLADSLLQNAYAGWSYGSIQEAINDANPGDIIHVPSGNYVENVVVNKTVMLIGNGSSTTVIDGGGSGAVVNVIANCVFISDFTIKNGNEGISITESAGSHVSRNVIISNNQKGVRLEDCDHNNIVNNTIISNQGVGLYVAYSNSTLACRNRIDSNNGYGIEIQHSSYSSVANNTLASNKGGIHILGSAHHNAILGNNILSNVIAQFEGDGIYVERAHASGPYPSNNTIVSNMINSSRNGIVLDFASNNTISGNLISHNDPDGILLWYAPSNVIQNNVMKSNRYSGIYIRDSDYTSITGNVCNATGIGIELSITNSCEIIGNVLTSNDFSGIYAYGSYSNIISQNEMVDNFGGIYLDSGYGGSNNKIYHNTFVNNEINAAAETGPNSWDNGTHGNFWDDYTGEDDELPHGIGDIPYDISWPDNVDRYPLVFVRHNIKVEPIWTFLRQMKKPYTVKVGLTNLREDENVTFTGVNQTKAYPQNAPWNLDYDRYDSPLLPPYIIGPGETSPEFQFDFTNEWQWIEPMNWKVIIDILLCAPIPGKPGRIVALLVAGWSTARFIEALIGLKKSVPEMTYTIEPSEGSSPFITFSVDVPVMVSIEKQEFLYASVVAGAAAMGTALASIFAPWLTVWSSVYTLQSLAFYAAATDPDPDYCQIAMPEPISIPEEIESLSEGPKKRLAIAQLELASLEKAHTTSYTRYQGAKEADNKACMELQLQATMKYNDMATKKMEEVQFLTCIVTTDMEPLNETQLTEVWNQINATGLPPSMQAILNEAGYNSSQIYEITQAILEATNTTELREAYKNPVDWAKQGQAGIQTHHVEDYGLQVTAETENLTVQPVHDVTITDVWPSATGVYVGEPVDINVKIRNYGSETEENFDVTAYANTTVVETRTVANLRPGEETTLTFRWNTAAMSPAYYRIKVVADNLPGEKFTADNRYVDGTVNLRCTYDTRVSSVIPFPKVVAWGDEISIYVTVENQGKFPETFDVTTNASTTVVETRKVTLTSGSSTVITFAWNTTGFAGGSYTISAYANPVLGETYTADNTYIDGWIIVSMLGDLTGPDGWPDGKCYIRDVAAVAKLFGAIYPNPEYDPNCDLTGPTTGVPDGKIDIRDVALIAKHFGDIDP